ncbi:Gag-Pol polyprotein, partial [Dictyocoela roeselum]
MLTSFPGERVAFDILEIKKNDLILLGIDYFTRKVFGKAINSKCSEKILEFIKCVHGEFPMKTLLTDNGGEFNNEILKNWCFESGIRQIFAIPYYHKSNGRIERANRTIRDALKHEKRPTKIVMKDVIENYNNSFHRGLGISPNEALNIKNWKHVLDKQKT